MNKTILIPELLLIAGQQQNVGKTTLACNIIARFSREYRIVALKVSPHIHTNVGDAVVVKENDAYSILKETTTESNKDTARMLKAGADEAFFVQAKPSALHHALEECFKLIPENKLLVCESAGVREYVEPGVFLMLRQLYCQVCSVDDDLLYKQADRIVTFTMNGFDLSMDQINVFNNKWVIRND